ncbi:hypothetical protein V8E53_007538 [Lactarius tabidus]
MSPSTAPHHSASGVGSVPIQDSHDGSDMKETGTKAKHTENRGIVSGRCVQFLHGTCGAAESNCTVQGYNKATIHLIPDSILLEVFNLCRKNRRSSAAFACERRPAAILEWELVHVCQRWRYLILASPSRLDLKLICSPGTPVRKALGFWPAFPIIIDYDKVAWKDKDDVIAALEHPDRIRRIGLSGLTRTLWEKLDAAMQEPFPALTHLSLIGPKDKSERAPVLPRKLMGGGTLRLQELYLDGMSCPALPQLLSSSRDLVNLRFTKIPSTRCVSPEEILTGLAGLTRLETLAIEFQPSTLSNFLADQRLTTTPVTPVVRLPSLKSFQFTGFCEYLEGLVAQIEAPQVTHFNIEYFSQPTYQVPQLSQFLVRSEYFKSPVLSSVRVQFIPWTDIWFIGSRSNSESINLTCKFKTSGMVRGVLHSVQLFQQISTSISISSIDNLTLIGPAPASAEPPFGGSLYGGSRYGGSLFGETLFGLLRIFPGVDSLYLRGELPENIIQALELASGDMVAKVLPALHTIEFCKEQPTVSVNRFVSVRQNAGRPVTIIYPENDVYEEGDDDDDDNDDNDNDDDDNDDDE